MSSARRPRRSALSIPASSSFRSTSTIARDLPCRDRSGMRYRDGNVTVCLFIPRYMLSSRGRNHNILCGTLLETRGKPVRGLWTTRPRQVQWLGFRKLAIAERQTRRVLLPPIRRRRRRFVRSWIELFVAGPFLQGSKAAIAGRRVRPAITGWGISAAVATPPGWVDARLGPEAIRHNRRLTLFVVGGAEQWGIGHLDPSRPLGQARPAYIASAVADLCHAPQIRGRNARPTIDVRPCWNLGRRSGTADHQDERQTGRHQPPPKQAATGGNRAPTRECYARRRRSNR